MVRARQYRAFLAVLVVGLIAGPAIADLSDEEAREFPRETEAVIEATVSLFEAAEAQRSPKSEAQTLALSPVPASSAADGADGDLSAFATDNGAVRHLTGYRITWYPIGTLYGAVDFVGTWQNARNLVCGYVTWDLSDPDAPEMRDLVVNYVDVSEVMDVSRDEREAALLNANCAYGDVDANYTVMN